MSWLYEIGQRILITDRGCLHAMIVGRKEYGTYEPRIRNYIVKTDDSPVAWEARQEYLENNSVRKLDKVLMLKSDIDLSDCEKMRKQFERLMSYGRFGGEPAPLSFKEQREEEDYMMKIRLSIYQSFGIRQEELTCDYTNATISRNTSRSSK